jgi:hypothetical protein
MGRRGLPGIGGFECRGERKEYNESIRMVAHMNAPHTRPKLRRIRKNMGKYCFMAAISGSAV